MPDVVPTYYLQFQEDNLEELRNDVWNDDPVPADLIVNDKTYDIDIAYRGSYTRKMRKKSYHIVFIHPTSFNGVREIHLNAEYKDPSLMRNKLSFDFFQDLGVLAPDSQHINLVRNDSLKGVYLQLESVDRFFLERRGLPKGPIYYAVNNDANFSLMRNERMKKDLLSGYDRILGRPEDDQSLAALIKDINTVSFPDFEERISQQLDIEKVLRWLVGAVCTMNNDGFTHNYALYRNSETGLFEVIPWDYDATWGRKVSGGIMHYSYVPPEGNKNNHLCYLLMRIPAIRARYHSLLEEILETKFTADYLENRVYALHNKIKPSVSQDPYIRKKPNMFHKEPEFILQFIKKRNNFLKQYLLDDT